MDVDVEITPTHGVARGRDSDASKRGRRCIGDLWNRPARDRHRSTTGECEFDDVLSGQIACRRDPGRIAAFAPLAPPPPPADKSFDAF